MLDTIRRILFRLFQEQKLRDDVITRLQVSIVGANMMPPGNVFALDHAIRRLPPKGVVLEIGSFGGTSANIILYLLKKHRQPHPLMTCDPWICEGFHDNTRGHDARYMTCLDGSESITRTAYMEYIQRSFTESLRLFHADRLPSAFRLRSDDFFTLWREEASAVDLFDRPTQLGGKISLAYIDGDHSYAQARRDFEHVHEALLPGGFVLMDDSAPFDHFGSAQFAREVAATYPDMRVVMKNPHYLFVKQG